MTARTKWYRGIDPVAITVNCDGDPHLITWRRGRLHLHDHDVASERAMVALGGERCVCLEVLDAWRSIDSDQAFVWAATAPVARKEPLQVLIAQHRLAAERLAARSASVRGRRSRRPPAVPGAAQAELRQELHRAVLLGLPDELRDVLVTSVVVRLLRRGLAQSRGFVIDLRELVAAKAVPAVQENVEAWHLRARGRKPVLDCWVAPAGSEPVICGLLDDVGGWVGIGLPASWLVDVWARRLALVDGCFVLSATLLAPGVADVVAARWERVDGRGATPVVKAALAVRTAGGIWRLHWMRPDGRPT